ncbi:MAG: NUDIX domain-containing protein [Planctomycetaceae bacterium]
MTQKNSYCSYCGNRYEEHQPWPRTCSSCNKTTYQNPIPVAVVLVPVDHELLVIRRNIEPRKGMLALPGGFIEVGESWRQGAKRELMEEVGIEISSESIKVFDVKSAPDGTVLIFGLTDRIGKEQIKLHPNSETQEIAFIDRAQELGFPLHTEVVRQYFKGPSVSMPDHR